MGEASHGPDQYQQQHCHRAGHAPPHVAKRTSRLRWATSCAERRSLSAASPIASVPWYGIGTESVQAARQINVHTLHKDDLMTATTALATVEVRRPKRFGVRTRTAL